MNARRRLTADLPDLVPGVTLVDVDEDLGVTPVKALLLDRVLGESGSAFWVDGANRSNTTRLTGRLETRYSPPHQSGWQSRSSRRSGFPSWKIRSK